MRELSDLIVLIKGGGEIASGVAHRLHRAHLKVCMTELPNPLAVSRGTTYSEAIFDGTKTIEGVTAELIPASLDEINRVWQEDRLPIVIDPHMLVKDMLQPDVFIDAIMAKKNMGTKISDAPLVIGLGPGFCAGKDVHIVIETHQGNNLGRVLLRGEPEQDTREPVSVGGLTFERVIWAEQAGTFTTHNNIGDYVQAGQVIAWLDDTPLKAPLTGMLRGLIRSGVTVPPKAKLIEVDHVHDSSVCNVIRDKMRAIAGGVLEAIMLQCNASRELQPATYAFKQKVCV
jgi:xanthine dehydrogenase accessory factor